MAKKNKLKNLSKSNKILYSAAIIVIVVPLLLLGYIYLSAKENTGKPTEGSRFGESLNPAIESKKVDEVKASMAFEGVDGVEVNLISATLRVSIDVNDAGAADTIEAIMNQAYENVNAILPIETYFTNNKSSVKMYDLEVHVYNYIPDETKPADGQIYMIKTKTAAATEANVSVPTTAKNPDVANQLLTEQAQAEADANQGQ